MENYMFKSAWVIKISLALTLFSSYSEAAVPLIKEKQIEGVNQHFIAELSKYNRNQKITCQDMISSFTVIFSKQGASFESSLNYIIEKPEDFGKNIAPSVMKFYNGVFVGLIGGAQPICSNNHWVNEALLAFRKAKKHYDILHKNDWKKNKNEEIAAYKKLYQKYHLENYCKNQFDLKDISQISSLNEFYSSQFDLETCSIRVNDAKLRNQREQEKAKKNAEKAKQKKLDDVQKSKDVAEYNIIEADLDARIEKECPTDIGKYVWNRDKSRIRNSYKFNGGAKDRSRLNSYFKGVKPYCI